MTSWFHLDRLDLVICVQSPRLGEKRPVPVSVTLTSKISPFKKIHLEKNPIGFRGRNEIPLLVLEASQVEGRMKEQQRFLFSRQSLCFLVGEKETMKLMIHFWADSLDSLIVHKSWTNFILATSAEVTKWWLKTSQLQKLVD